MPDLEWNKKVWDKEYAWPQDGDEWDEAAKFCNVPYDSWKAQLLETFAAPHIRGALTMLEIGPGHGRWSEYFASRVAGLHLVDLSPACIKFCRKRLAGHQAARYHVTDGQSLPGIPDGSIEFVWSFDTFVHLEEPEIRAYMTELKRVMKPQAVGVIHHAGTPTAKQRQDGMRSKVDARKMGKILEENGLFCVRQTDSWGKGCNVKFAGDLITVFARP